MESGGHAMTKNKWYVVMAREHRYIFLGGSLEKTSLGIAKLLEVWI